MTKLILMALVLLTGCAAAPKPAPKAYEYEFTLEINGKIVQRQRGVAREVPLK